jgi:hypothetical protein
VYPQLISFDSIDSRCALDNINGARSLPYTLTNSAKTISGCLAAAKAAGYAVAALSYMGECYAGAALSSASTTLDASRCMMACSGDSTGKTTCGGSNALDVYISKTVSLCYLSHNRRSCS